MNRPVYLNAQAISKQMDPRIQIGDVVYFLSADGQKILCLEDPTDFGLIPNQDFSKMKFETKLLVNQNIQNLPNRCFFQVCTSKAEIGSQVRYGDMVCFKLDCSSSYITQLTEPEPDMAHYKISFTNFEEDPNEVPYPKEFCWKFRPKYKHRQDGGFVFENDKVSIETFLDQEGFLTPMAHGKIAGGLNEYEWKIKTFSDTGDASLIKIGEVEEVPIRAQEPVTFFSFESGKYLGVEAGTGEKSLIEYVEKYFKDSQHMLTLIDNQVQENKNYFKTTGFYQNKIFREKQQEENTQPFNGLYRIELEDPLQNETLKTGSKVRISHVQYGGYLTLVKREDLEKINKAEEQESQENQQDYEEINEYTDYDEEEEFFKEESKKEIDTNLQGEADEEEEEEDQQIQQKQAQLSRSQTTEQTSFIEKMKAQKEELQKTMEQKKQQIQRKISQVKQDFQQATHPSQEGKQKIAEGRYSIISQPTQEKIYLQDQKKISDWMFILQRQPTNSNLFEIQIITQNLDKSIVTNKSLIAFKCKLRGLFAGEQQQQEGQEQIAYLGVDQNQIKLTQGLSEKNHFEIQKNSELIKGLWNYAPEYCVVQQVAALLQKDPVEIQNKTKLENDFKKKLDSINQILVYLIKVITSDNLIITQQMKFQDQEIEYKKYHNVEVNANILKQLREWHFADYFIYILIKIIKNNNFMKQIQESMERIENEEQKEQDVKVNVQDEQKEKVSLEKESNQQVVQKNEEEEEEDQSKDTLAYFLQQSNIFLAFYFKNNPQPLHTIDYDVLSTLFSIQWNFQVVSCLGNLMKGDQMAKAYEEMSDQQIIDQLEKTIQKIKTTIVLNKNKNRNEPKYPVREI